MITPNGWENSQKFLIEHGIDPATVLVDGFGNGGYYTCLFNDDGSRKLLGGDQFATQQPEWPDAETAWKATHAKYLDTRPEYSEDS